ncbi:MAG TPA: universal stress protein [Vicinamibacterales bacterium]|jgi:nucleotide-binding universal stress UspA family protein|nr:universal stress protein [Vicinamibacterales bacterium]
MREPKRTARFRSILCSVDFSGQSREAVKYASSIAPPGGGRITFLFVNDPLLLAAAGVAYHAEREFLRRARVELERFVAQSIGRSQRSRPVIAYEIALGAASDEILGASKRLKSDLIVMGTHGLSGVRKLFFGSTTEQVLRQVDMPVLAVPPSRAGARFERRRGRAGQPFARVIAPVDLDRRATRDIQAAADLAIWCGAELLLVHVLPRLHTPPWLRRTGNDQDRVRSAEVLLNLKATQAGLPHPLRFGCRVVVGEPADEIAALAAAGPRSVVAMALCGEDRLFLRRGAIAYRVLTHAAAPVFALPSRAYRTRR